MGIIHTINARDLEATHTTYARDLEAHIHSINARGLEATHTFNKCSWFRGHIHIQ